MDNIKKRFILFLLLCIPTRLAMTVYSFFNSVYYLAIFTSFISIGFAVIYLFDLRKTGNEVFGDKIWWNNLRPLHSLLYGLFSYFALTSNPSAWIFLGIDTSIGILSFLIHHSIIISPL